MLESMKYILRINREVGNTVGAHPLQNGCKGGTNDHSSPPTYQVLLGVHPTIKPYTNLLFSVSFITGLGLHIDGISRVVFRAAARPAFFPLTRSLKEPAVFPLARSISKPFSLNQARISQCLYDIYLYMLTMRGRGVRFPPGVSCSWLLKGLKDIREQCLIILETIFR